MGTPRGMPQRKTRTPRTPSSRKRRKTIRRTTTRNKQIRKEAKGMDRHDWAFQERTDKPNQQYPYLYCTTNNGKAINNKYYLRIISVHNVSFFVSEEWRVVS